MGFLMFSKINPPNVVQEIKFKPKYYRNWKIISLTIAAKIKFTFYNSSNPQRQLKSNLTDGIIKTLRLKKKLFLYKLIYFNKQYYSTPTIPAFPSKAYNNMLIKGGLNFFSAGTKAKTQVDSVFIAVTNKCRLKCEYCYEKFNLNQSNDISTVVWKEIIKSLQSIGVNIFILSGGEPLLDFNKLLEILISANKELSDFHLHTSGDSITLEKVKQLKAAGLKAAAVGLDNFVQEKHDIIRGKDSFSNAIKALQLFNQAGILTYVNLCVSNDILTADNLYRYLEFVKGLNVSMIQLLEPRPCGGYINNKFKLGLNADDKKKLAAFTLNGNRKRAYKNYPLIYYVAHIESKNLMGCHMGGLSHFYIDSKGNVCPCVFFPVNYGNVLKEDILSIYNRMRKNIPSPLHTECPSMLLADRYKELYYEEKQLPIPFDKIQTQIDNLYNKNLNDYSLKSNSD